MRNKLLSLALLLCSGTAFAEVPSSSEIWSGLAAAVDMDLFSNGSLQREANRKAAAESVKKKIDDIKKTFSNPYSAQSVDYALHLTVEVIADPNLSDTQVKEVQDLYESLCEYGILSENVRKSLTLSSGDKSFKRIGELLNMKNMAPVYIEWMASDLKGAYETNGLFKFNLDKRYVFLNDRIKNVEEKLDSMKEIKNGKIKEMISVLRDVQNTVNGISPDFPKEVILFDQKFENR